MLSYLEGMNATTTKALARRPNRDVHIRWMIRRDAEQVVKISRSTDMPLSPRLLVKHLRDLATIGMVAEVGDKVVGFMVYHLARKRLEVAFLAVDPMWQRQGVGTAMVDRLISKLAARRRTGLRLDLGERNVVGQVWLRGRGFRAVGWDRDDEVIRFEWTLKGGEDEDGAVSFDDLGVGVS